MELLFLKSIVVNKNNLKLIYSKSDLLYDEKENPIVEVTIVNCQRAKKIMTLLEEIDPHNDGVELKIGKNKKEVFVSNGYESLKILCDNVKKEKRPYNTQELKEIITILEVQNNGLSEKQNTLYSKLNTSRKTIRKLIDTIDLKLHVAKWMKESTKQKLLGQKKAYLKVLREIK